MPTLPDSIASNYYRRMHHAVVSDRDDIDRLLERARAGRVVLNNGFDGFSNPRTATIEWVGDDRVGLSAQYIRPERQPQICLNFEIDGVRYFFASPPATGCSSDGGLEIERPSVIYKAERRDLPREGAPRIRDPSLQVELSAKGWKRLVVVVNSSPGGLAVELANVNDDIPDEVDVKYLSGTEAGVSAFGLVRHRSPLGNRPGWTKIGLAVTGVRRGSLIDVVVRDRILGGTAASRPPSRLSLLSGAARSASYRLGRRIGLLRNTAPVLNVVEYPNDKGQPIKALVDRSAVEPGGVAVVIPPAWGRTKETLLPLALTIKRTFEAAGEAVTVLRFDGTHRRGESHIDPAFREDGDEYLGFTFSQAASDINSTVEFLAKSEEFRPSKIILVTVSIASVDGRRAVATDPTGLIKGWVALVGIVDLQACLRTASGGVDYGVGLPRGVKFGRQELTGRVVDIDLAGPDALEHKLLYLEDAWQDMAAINVPVTWIHGRHDGWMDLARVRDLMSVGGHSERSLLEVPTGHQLRTSREALEVFQLVAEEVGRMSLDRTVRALPLDIAELDLRRTAERARRPRPRPDLRKFWHDYLVGRDGRIGIQLVTATNAYHDLITKQVQQLNLQPNDRIVDLGSGVGDFAFSLLSSQGTPKGISIDAVDFVPEALARARSRLLTHSEAAGNMVRHTLADLDLRAGDRIPMADQAFSAALGSLVISYFREPRLFLKEVRRILVPGGRLVLSSMRRDADTSQIYAAARAELHPERLRELFGDLDGDLEEVQRQFLNDNARLFNLEEEGYFRFWDADELCRLVESAGFSIRDTTTAFGDPTQAVVVAATRT